MVQMETLVRIVDNSGGLVGKCIQVYNKRIGRIGDFILVSIQRLKKRKEFFLKKNVSTRKRVEMGLLYKGIIVNTKTRLQRGDGQSICFFSNNVVLLSRTRNTLLGTRILSPVVREFRHFKYLKYILLNLRQKI